MLDAKRFGLLAFAALVFACGSPAGEHVEKSSAALVTAVGVDYSWARPDPSGLHAEGYTFAARYLGHDTSGKTISGGEADALWAAGLDVVVVWEDSAGAALDGFGRGAADAQAADAQAAAAGMPAGRPIYFAVDFDAQGYQQGAIDSYFAGVASVIGLARTGAYGGFYLIQRLFDDGAIAWGWQTYAWSYGNWDARAQLQQVLNGITAAGDGDCCDRDEALAADFGQWHAGRPPVGYLDTADCTTGLTGWAQDPDAPAAAVGVVLTFDGPAFSPGSQAVALVANASRADLCGPLGSCEHGFSRPIPLAMLDGKSHPVWAYGLDNANGAAGVLVSSSRTFQCPLATPPRDAKNGVKRHVVDPDSYAAWRFAGLTDLTVQPDPIVDAYATSADWSAKPAVVIADDGSPEVWLIDGEVRRHITSPDSFVAWHFTWGDIQKTPAADVYKYAKGLDLPAAPYLLQGTGPAIWVLDDAPGSSSSSPSTPGTPGSPSAEGSSGCSMGAARSDVPAFFFLAPLLIFVRRKRSRGESVLSRPCAVEAPARRVSRVPGGGRVRDGLVAELSAHRL